jgi:23S rRNA pseudouridine1911/1915/1917 synthase
MENSRLDVEITSRLQLDGTVLSRSQVQKLIDNSLVKINGKTCIRPGTRLCSGDMIEVAVSDLLPTYEPSALSQSLPIIYKDDHIIVVNKPAGISVHPGIMTKGNTVVEGLLHYLEDFGEGLDRNPRLGVVHRIDKDTTGLVVLARTTPALTLLSRQFAEKSAYRSYQALVLASPRGKRKIQLQPTGSIITGFARHPRNRLKFAVVPESIKKAETHWQLMDDLGYASIVSVVLKTGRTHQIRVHMEHLGSPIIGDRLYGDTASLPPPLKRKADTFGRQALHAESLQFVHPHSGQAMSFTAELPQDHAELVSFFRQYQLSGG